MVAGWHPGGASRVAGARELPAGWWCCDGDNFVAGDVLQFYDEGTLAAARPVAAMAVSARVQMGGTKVIQRVGQTTARHCMRRTVSAW
jgi:hypothetical protein